ncbi:MAG: hypothetical protein GY729_14120 [Desulfobacteraceae bacterium]|nr:hypothetical protein [Desulfobacteraceae bacterium]
MPEYIYKAKNKIGRTIKGEYEGSDIKSAEAYLKRRNLTDFTVKEKPKDIFANVGFMQPKITAKDVIIF